jgi:deoxyribose-phosphate aldolase
VELSRYIDHTWLRPEATAVDIQRLCREAVEYHFYAVIVNPVYIPLAAKILKKSDVLVGSVAGFPLGASQTEVKMAEAIRAEADGADEIDFVANIGLIQSGAFAELGKELVDVRRRLSRETVLKVIIETPLIKPEVWQGAVDAVARSGAEFVKSATGFFGATQVEHVRRLQELAAGRIKIKAAGGIRTAAEAQAMIEAGAARIGSSASVAIVESLKK